MNEGKLLIGSLFHTNISRICRWRQCKHFQVRRIFHIERERDPCLILYTVCYFTHSVSFYTQCVILHKVSVVPLAMFCKVWSPGDALVTTKSGQTCIL